MRSVKELLILLLAFLVDREKDNVKPDGKPVQACDFFNEEGSMNFWGMCNSIHRMKRWELITEEEWELMHDYIQLNIPEDILADHNNNAMDVVWWWNPVVRAPRIKWLKEQIKIQEDAE